MTTLWPILIVMILVASLFVVLPVWYFRPVTNLTDNEIRKQKNRVLYQQNLDELDDDLERKLINSDEFEKLKAELQRGFIGDMAAMQKLQAGSVGSVNKRIPLLLMLIIPLLSFVLYEQLGSSRELVLPELLGNLSSAQTETELEQALDNLALALDDRFARRPDDIVNGYQLGNLYLQLERYNQAADIFSQLADMMEDSPDKATVLGQLAQAQYLSSDSELSAETRSVMDQALALNPNQYSVLTILAVEAFVNQDFVAAVGYWRRQLLQEAPGSAQAVQLLARIAQVEELLPAQTGVTLPAGAASITVYVEVDDSIRGQIADDMRLFIFARGETMPLPLAAQTFAIAELPITITLDDSMAMTPQFTLSSTANAYVGATIGRNAIAEPGDFRAVSEIFVVAEQEDTIRLLIKDIVP